MTDAAVPARRQDINSMIPRDFDQALKAAEVLAKSSIVPKDFQNNPGNVLVAIQWGMELGLPPLQAMQNIAVINGRPALWGDAVLALVRASGLLEAIEEEVTDAGARCTVKRRGEAPVTREFTAEDAKRAGLLGKAGPWQQYPKRMLQMRARAFALRDVFPDVLKGMAVAEEIADIGHAPARGDGDGERLARGIAGLKARLLPKAEEDGDGAKDGAPAKAAAETEKTAEPKPEAPQQKKKAAPKKGGPLPVRGGDGSVASSVATGGEWLAEYRRIMAEAPHEERPAIAAANMPALRMLAKRAPEGMRADFQAELEAAEAVSTARPEAGQEAML
ncbi:MAG TPA: hypothetical protein ENJ38_08370 [Rhodospirillales bacterium]|nr:hypothetical protein [Rhodospirillales bacterium]